MNFKNFVSLVERNIISFLPEEYATAEVTIKTIHKTNTERIALSVYKEDTEFSPCVYLDRYYQDMEDGQSFDDIMNRIADVFVNAKPPKYDIGFTRESVKDKVFFSLINAKMNKSRLENAPHIIVNDLAITFRVLARKDKDSMGSVFITNELAKEWGFSVDELHALAKENTIKLFPAKLQKLSDIAKDMLRENVYEEFGITDEELDLMLPEPSPDMPALYVLSNEVGINGASTLLYNDVLDTACEKMGCESILIIPSSIHEIILLDASHTNDIEYLRNMVHEVNTNEVATKDILSGNVYTWSRKAKFLSIAA